MIYKGCDIPPDRVFDVDGDLWVRFEGDLARLGMTDVAQTRLGKLVSIRFKKPGRAVRAGGSVATVESAKFVGPIHTPFACEVVAGNEAAFADDVLVANRDPYEAGWISMVRPDDADAAHTGLLSGDDAVAAYRARIDDLELSCFRCAD